MKSLGNAHLARRSTRRGTLRNNRWVKLINAFACVSITACMAPEISNPEKKSMAAKTNLSAAHVSLPTPGPSPSPSSSPIPSGIRTVLLAQGHMGRTMISCDQGQSWIQNRSDSESIRCFENGYDCDHQSSSGTGITYSDGWFFASFGWGAPGTLRRSQDGVNWQTVQSGPTFAGLTASPTRVFAGSQNSYTSTNHGVNWSALQSMPFGPGLGNVRRGAYVPHGSGLFVFAAQDSSLTGIQLTSDGGATFYGPASLPSGCINYIRSFAYGGGVILLNNGDGTICRSSDGGMNWTASRITTAGGDTMTSNEGKVIWDGTRFMTWGYGSQGWARYVSTNGATWFSTVISPQFSVGTGLKTSNGTYVVTVGGWQVWYESQRFYRSTDGITWTELGVGSAARSHPINHMVEGQVPANAYCN